MNITPGTTNVTVYVYLQDSTTGLAKTGLTYASAGVLFYYTRPLDAAIIITPATQTVTGAHSDGGFVEVDATNAKGFYRLDLLDAVCAVSPVMPVVYVHVEFDGVKEVTMEIGLGTHTNVTMVSDDATAATNLEAMYDGTGYVGGTAKLTVDVAKISGGATAADNVEAMYDGTGYAGGTIKLGVDIVSISSDTTAADNLELDYDGTGLARANSTIGTVTTIGATGLAAINAEVVDTLATDTYAEVGAVVAATSSLSAKINWLFALARNKITSTATTITIRNDSDSGDIATSTQSDDATTYTRSEWT